MSYWFIYGSISLVIIVIELSRFCSTKLNNCNQQLQSNIVVRIKNQIFIQATSSSGSNILVFVPQIEHPSTKTYIQYKLLWTLIALVIYLIAADIPLFGIIINDNTEPNALHWFHPILSSKPLTLMELGILPTITSDLIFQSLAAINIISIDKNNKSEQTLFYAIQKFVTIYVITVAQAIALISTGTYGHWLYDLGIFSSCLILIQLCSGSLIVILFDEIIQIGYGIGSGISLFRYHMENILTNTI
eukprot:190706_1